VKQHQGQISGGSSEFIIEFGSLASGGGGKWESEKVNKWKEKSKEWRVKGQ